MSAENFSFIYSVANLFKFIRIFINQKKKSR